MYPNCNLMWLVYMDIYIWYMDHQWIMVMKMDDVHDDFHDDFPGNGKHSSYKHPVMTGGMVLFLCFNMCFHHMIMWRFPIRHFGVPPVIIHVEFRFTEFLTSQLLG